MSSGLRAGGGTGNAGAACGAAEAPARAEKASAADARTSAMAASGQAPESADSLRFCGRESGGAALSEGMLQA